jgi:RNA polymerase sigma-70 factor (ECF subfamily)
MNEIDDAARVRDCLQGDPQAFVALVERYEKPVYNVALRMLRNREDARDVAQTTFLKAYQSLSSYDSQFRFYSWIYRIAINESLNALRSRRREAGPVDEWHASSDPGPDEVLEAEREWRELLDAVESLKPDYRAVVVLKYFAGQSYQDMAVTLEIDEKTVKSRLFTARQLLKDRLVGPGEA